MTDASSSVARSLALVGQAMRPAEEPWWVIGSAAAALHGAAVTVADVDVVLSLRDAYRLLPALGLPVAPGSPHRRFRSAVFATWREPPCAVEFMAGFELRRGETWVPVWPAGRVAITLPHGDVFVPEREELISLFEAFGRPQDRARVRAMRG